MKITVTFLAHAECLLIPTCFLGIFKRDFFFFLNELAMHEAIKAARHTPQQPDQWNESGLQCAGCLGVSAGMRLLKCSFPDSGISSPLIQIFSSWTDFPPYLSQCSLSHALFVCSGCAFLAFLWLTLLMMFVSPFPDLQLSAMHAQTCTVGTHSKTANGSLCRVRQWGKQCPFTPKRKSEPAVCLPLKQTHRLALQQGSAVYCILVPFMRHSNHHSFSCFECNNATLIKERLLRRFCCSSGNWPLNWH